MLCRDVVLPPTGTVAPEWRWLTGDYGRCFFKGRCVTPFSKILTSSNTNGVYMTKRRNSLRNPINCSEHCDCFRSYGVLIAQTWRPITVRWTTACVGRGGTT